MASKPECTDDVRKVVFGGDTHGDIGQVRWLIDKAKKEDAQAVFVLGDFGIWSHLDRGAFVQMVSESAVEHGIPVFFLPGNHENYDLLKQYERDNERTSDGFVVITHNVFYSPRGHRWEWSGVKFLSLGGAYSVDVQPRVMQDWALQRMAEAKQEQGRALTDRERYVLRTGHLSWWPQEEITDEERDLAMEGGEVDVMLTHDKPLKSRPEWNRKDIPECMPNQEKIQVVVDATRPKLLLHGHLHYAYTDSIVTGEHETFVKGLDCDPMAGGERQSSFAVLTVDRSTPSRPEPGADEDCFNLGWSNEDHEVWGRDFLRRGREH